MCLDRVDEIREPNDDMVVGYKVFDPHEEIGVFEGEIHGGTYTMGKSYKAKGRLITEGDKKYPAGFHVFKAKASAVEWVGSDDQHIVEVMLWDVRAVGQQVIYAGHAYLEKRTLSTYVAKNMRLMRQVA